MGILAPVSRVSPKEDKELGALSELAEQKENFLDSTSNGPFLGNMLISDHRGSHICPPVLPALVNWQPNKRPASVPEIPPFSTYIQSFHKSCPFYRLTFSSNLPLLCTHQHHQVSPELNCLPAGFVRPLHLLQRHLHTPPILPPYSRCLTITFRIKPLMGLSV